MTFCIRVGRVQYRQAETLRDELKPIPNRCAEEKAEGKITFEISVPQTCAMLS